MSEKLKAFTIRIPADLHDQIQARADINRRKKNAEIIAMLEETIDTSVERDLKLARSGPKAF
jgi:hypothetical protein